MPLHHPPLQKSLPSSFVLRCLSTPCIVVVILQAEAAIVSGILQAGAVEVCYGAASKAAKYRVMLQAEQQLSMVRCRQSSNGRIGTAAGRSSGGATAAGETAVCSGSSTVQASVVIAVEHRARLSVVW